MLYSQVRYFDGERRRAGLPPDVAALVTRIEKDLIELEVVNLNAAESRQLVEEYAKFLENCPSLKMRVSGHTDERGSEEYNIVLGEKRAGSVEKFIKDLGITDNRIRTVSYGEAMPAAIANDINADSEDLHQKNRRVEFELDQ